MTTIAGCSAQVRALNFALRLGLVIALMLTAAHFYSRQVVTLMLPTLAAALKLVADDFTIVQFDVVDERNQASLAAVALLGRTVVLGGRAIVPDGQSVMVVATTIGTVLQPIWVAWVMALAWPARMAELALRIVMASAMLVPVVLLDTPLSLAAWLWDVMVRLHEPSRASPLLWWNVFLNGGGRLVLGLIAGFLSIALAQRAMKADKRVAGRSGARHS